MKRPGFGNSRMLQGVVIGSLVAGVGLGGVWVWAEKSATGSELPILETLSAPPLPPATSGGHNASSNPSEPTKIAVTESTAPSLRPVSSSGAAKASAAQAGKSGKSSGTGPGRKSVRKSQSAQAIVPGRDVLPVPPEMQEPENAEPIVALAESETGQVKPHEGNGIAELPLSQVVRTEAALEQTSNQFWLRMLGSLVFVCLLILGTWKWLGPRFAQRQAQSGNPSPGSAGAGFLPHRAFTTSLQQVLGQPPSETTEPTDAFKVISSKVLTRHVELFLVEIKDRQLVLSVSPQGTQVLTVFAPPPVPFPMHEELSTALEEPSAPVELPPPLRRISAARQNALGTSAEREPSLPKKPSPIPKAQQELAQSQMANDYPTEHYLIDELFEASPVKAKSKANARNGRLPDVSRPVNSVGITPPVLNRMPTLTPDDVVVLDDYEDHYLS